MQLPVRKFHFLFQKGPNLDSKDKLIPFFVLRERAVRSSNRSKYDVSRNYLMLMRVSANYHWTKMTSSVCEFILL